MVPSFEGTDFVAAKICFVLGEAKMSPQATADNAPSPTNPDQPGSWPEPPPLITDTVLGSFSFEKTTRSESMRPRWGLAAVRALRYRGTKVLAWQERAAS